jgi:flavin-dependent dehydrogenase
MDSLYDAAIIGGGPAGSTAAALLAMKGRRVVLLEREKFPRFHIGESLLPYSMGAFERLGIQPWLKGHGYPKFGGEIATACGSRAVKFYFKDGFRLAHHSAYQVERATFDQALLSRAAELGAEIREQTTVKCVTFDPDGATLELETGAPVRARYVIDSAGRHSVVGRQHGEKIEYPDLKKFSCFAHFAGVQRDEGMDAGLTRLVRAEHCWFWLIPLDDARTSIGVVMDSAAFKEWKCSPEAALTRAIEEAPLMRDRMEAATRTTQVYALGDYSYRHARLTGPRWMLAGDAAGFIDPIFSTGVFLAVHSGEHCADAIDAVLTSPARQPKLFRTYARDMHRVMDMYLRFVTAWYRPEFAEVFTTPTPRFQLAPAVNAVLAGNVGTSFPIWWRMQLFYLVLYLQRFFPLCPRISWAPKPDARMIVPMEPAIDRAS